MTQTGKMILGTAQIGMEYGIANKVGRLGVKKALKLLKFAWKNGINTFDTAPGYGNSEKIIGFFVKKYFNNQTEKPIIITKLTSLNKLNLSHEILYKKIKTEVQQSIINLNLEFLPYYLLHDPLDLYHYKELIIDCLSQIQDEGLIKQFGISAYTPEDVTESMRYKEISVIQVPINIFDHRLIKSKLLDNLHEKKYEIFARSIYLQGLFFKPLRDLPHNLKIAEKPLRTLNRIVESYNLEIVELCALFVRDIPEITKMVIGAEKKDQIKNNLDILEKKPLNKETREVILNEFAEIPKKLIDPREWNI